MEYPHVVVNEEWLAKAKQWGTERDALNGGNDTPAYAHNGTLPYSSLTASRLAVVAEIGAHLFLGVDPSSTTFVVDRTKANYEALRANADLEVAGRKIEVRNATTPLRPMPIKKKDVAADAIVIQAYVEMEKSGSGHKPTGRVFFLNWAEAAKAWDFVPVKRNDTAYKQSRRPMDDLRVMLSA